MPMISLAAATAMAMMAVVVGSIEIYGSWQSLAVLKKNAKQLVRVPANFV